MKQSLSPLLCSLLFSSAPLLAAVTLPPIFSEHMVLQKTEKVPVWGKADPGEDITVSFNGQTATAKTGDDGKWMTSLSLKDSPPGPFELTIKGKNEIKIKDVVVGQVWLASGQSNMAFVLKDTDDSKNEVAASENPLLRQFSVKNVTSRTPSETAEGQWTVASPATSGKFTAVGYYFGQTLQRDLQVPVGVISSSWGGTQSEAWTSKEAIDLLPGVAEARERQLKALDDVPTVRQDYITANLAWLKTNNREDRPTANLTAYAGADAGQTKWTTVKLPGPITGDSLPSTGAIWLKKEIDIPANLAGQILKSDYILTGGFDSVYWNGELINAVTPAEPSPTTRRQLTIPADKVKAGKNTLAIRIFSPLEKPAVTGTLTINNVIKLAGDWQAASELPLPAPEATVAAAAPALPPTPMAIHNIASTLYNGMISPLLPYAIKGAIWYQGESNSGRSYEYRQAFPIMIEDWRARWQQGAFPFYFVQLANFMPRKPEPAESGWAELREAQSMTLKLPKTGQAVIIDIGEATDIHPRNKKDVGQRLALIALANDYGKSVEFSGPVYKDLKIEGNKARVSFTHVDGGLVAKPLGSTYPLKTLTNETAALVRNSPLSEVEGFAICGADKKWFWADAKIEGQDIVVSSDKVAEPVAVRYAWADNPVCNLANSAGLPASPFRTDDFPGATINAKYSQLK